MYIYIYIYIYRNIYIYIYIQIYITPIVLYNIIGVYTHACIALHTEHII